MLAAGLLIGLAAPADAGIQSVGGAMEQIGAPTGFAPLASNDVESETNIRIWYESTVKINGTIAMDHVNDGLGTLVSSNASANPGNVTFDIADSFLVHFDQENAVGANTVDLTGSVVFDRNIIGIWHSTGGLSGSDATWEPVLSAYGGSLQARPYELGSDRYRIEADNRTLTIVNTRTIGSGVDQLRILVSPEPGSGALLAFGIAGLVLRARRRRRRVG